MARRLLSGPFLCYEGQMKTWKSLADGLHCRGRGRIVVDVWLQAPGRRRRDAVDRGREDALHAGDAPRPQPGDVQPDRPPSWSWSSRGSSDMVLKKEHKVDLDKYGPKVDALARKRGQERVAIEKEQAKTFLDQAGQEPGAVVTPSGMVFRTVTPGTGATPDADRSRERAVRRAPHRRDGLRQHQEARRRRRRPSRSTASSSAGPRGSGG